MGYKKRALKFAHALSSFFYTLVVRAKLVCFHELIIQKYLFLNFTLFSKNLFSLEV